jgi:hypothetical protein
VDQPIAYGSCKTNKAYKNYSAAEAEMLAVTWATKHLGVTFMGRKLFSERIIQY